MPQTTIEGMTEYNETNANGLENLKVPEYVSFNLFRENEILIRVEIFREPLRRLTPHESWVIYFLLSFPRGRRLLPPRCDCVRSVLSEL